MKKRRGAGALRVLVVAGEASADALAADALRALRTLCGAVESFGVGGPLAAAEGLRTVARAEALSVMGIGEVIGEVPRLARLQRRLVWLAERLRPDVALLCDMPDFNMPLGHRLRLAGVPVVGLAAPQAWAWRPGRAAEVGRCFDRLLVLFPFEAPFFQRAGVDARFIGHPLVTSAPCPAPLAARDAVALLPGSRPGELRRHLGVLLEAAPQLRALTGATRLLLPVAPTLEVAQVAAAVAAAGLGGEVELLGSSAAALGPARLAVCASGTATLEAALAHTPTVVIHRAATTTWLLGRLLIQTSFIAMPNLLAGRSIFPELIQHRVTAEGIAQAARFLRGAPEPDWAAVTSQLQSPDGRPPAAHIAAHVLEVAG